MEGKRKGGGKRKGREGREGRKRRNYTINLLLEDDLQNFISHNDLEMG